MPAVRSAREIEDLKGDQSHSWRTAGYSAHRGDASAGATNYKLHCRRAIAPPEAAIDFACEPFGGGFFAEAITEVQLAAGTVGQPQPIISCRPCTGAEGGDNGVDLVCGNRPTRECESGN